MIPQHLRDSFDRYAQHGIPCGDFLNAVLENNLMESFGRADVQNRFILFDICSYVYNEMPYSCHGSKEKVKAWIESKREVSK
jgi:hypothetical protein